MRALVSAWPRSRPVGITWRSHTIFAPPRRQIRSATAPGTDASNTVHREEAFEKFKALPFESIHPPMHSWLLAAGNSN